MSLWYKRFKPIPDPIYDSIHIPGNLLSFINNPIFQKLRYKRQLACAHLIYPSLNNTRFEHSLGVFHLMSIFLRRFLSEIENRIVVPAFYDDNESINLIEKKREKLNELISIDIIFELLIAALYHDIGQSAFSHLIDNVGRRNPEFNIQNDKNYSEKLIKENVILDKIFNTFNKNLLKEKNKEVNRENITNIITKGIHSIPELYFLSELLNSSVDLDRLDYMNRDCYYSGIINLKIPYNFIMASIRIFPYIHIIENEEKENKVFFRLCYDLSAIHSLEFLLISRYFMYKQIYHHERGKIAENMIGKAIEISLENKLITSDDLHLLGDEELLIKLKENEESKKLVERYYNRDLYNIAFKKNYSQLNNQEKTKLIEWNVPFEFDFVRKWERKLANKIGLDETEVIIDIPISRFNETKVKLWDEKSKSLCEFEEHTEFKNIQPYSIDYILCAISTKDKLDEANKNLFKVI